MEVVGKIILALPMQEGVAKNTGTPWQSQSYVLETIEQYPKKVCFELFGEQRIKDNPCKIDDIVTVSFDIDSHEFNGKWYTRIRAWKVQQGDNTASAAGAGAPADTVAAAPAATANTASFDEVAADDNSALPF